jgi:hypothetical protein
MFARQGLPSSIFCSSSSTQLIAATCASLYALCLHTENFLGLIFVFYTLPGLATAGVTRAAVTAWHGYAVDSKHRSDEEMHEYLDSLFCLKGKVALVTGTVSPGQGI